MSKFSPLMNLPDLHAQLRDRVRYILSRFPSKTQIEKRLSDAYYDLPFISTYSKRQLMLFLYSRLDFLTKHTASYDYYAADLSHSPNPYQQPGLSFRDSLNLLIREGLTGIGLSHRGGAHQLSHRSYRSWMERNRLTEDDRERICKRIQALRNHPFFSVIVPVFNTEERWLRKCLDSVLHQHYPFWELCIADDASTSPHVRGVLEEYRARDERIKVVYRSSKGHISEASNSAMELATGSFVVFLDHDDELAEHALYLIAEEINSNPDADLIYSDEDKIDERGVHSAPHFKPDWNPDLLYCCNYICHLTAYRTEIVRRVGGFRKGFEGSQDHDLLLRFSEATSPSHIHHVPHILYHWRSHSGSTARSSAVKGYAHTASRKAVQEHLERQGIAAEVVPAQCHHTYNRVLYPVPSSPPLVSVIIPTRNHAELLQSCISGIICDTDYPNMEIIIMDNGSDDPGALEYLVELEKLAGARVIHSSRPFNYSFLNNEGVRWASGGILAFLNNDLQVKSSGWLREMVSHAIRPEVGAVGAKLLYPNGRVQHAGVVLGVGGLAEHAFRGFDARDPGYASRLQLTQNYSAVTGACMLTRREVFDEVGGFDALNLAIAYNDVDYCLKVTDAGYRIVWTPYAELFHLESASRGTEETPENRKRLKREAEYMLEKWKKVLQCDFCYNPNFANARADFSLGFSSGVAKPWE
jgi:O-antigen biosynthesis protein